MNTKFSVSIFILISALMVAIPAKAQVAISEEGVTFPGGDKQTAAVIVPVNCPHGDAIVWDSNAVGWVCETDLSPAYAVTDTGPGGGIVFHTTDGGVRGLEAAPYPQETQAEWCSGPSDIAGVDNIDSEVAQDSHSGAHNTPLIVAECGAGSAAGIAAAYVWPNGQTDGFLPNKEELGLIRQNLYLTFHGGFSGDGYWSSSENDADRAWAQHFQTGLRLAGEKHEAAVLVRAVRAF